MCLISQSWKENIQTAKRRLCSLRRNRENWSDVTVPFLKPTLRWYSCNPQPPLMCHLTRIIICCSKQALNQNKFHPPSKQPIAAHLPPFLKQPHRSPLWPAVPTRHMGSEAACRFTRQISSTKCTGQIQAKIIPKRRGGKVREGEEDVDRDSQSFTLHTFA